MVPDENCVVLLLEKNETDANIIIQGFSHVDVEHGVRHVANVSAMLDYLKQSVANIGKKDSSYIKPRLIVFGIEELNDEVIGVLNYLQEDNQLKRVPVLILSSTANSNNESIVKAYQLKINSFLIKPDDREELAEIAREVGSYWLKWNQLPP